MKKFILWIAVTFTIALAAKEPLAATLAYRMVTADQAEVTITVTGQGRPAIKLPEVPGGRWLENQKSEGSSMQSSFVNGKGSTRYTFTCTLPLLLTQEEAVTIPPVVVTLDGERTQTEPVAIPPRAERGKAMRNAESGTVDLADLSATLTFSGGTYHFVGEAIAFTLTVAVPLPARLTDITLPEFPDAGNLIFATRRNAALIALPPERRGNLAIYRFEGAFKSMKGASIPTAAKVVVSLVIPSARRSSFFDDPFFSGMRGTQVVRELQCQSEVKQLQIRSLPPTPDGAYDLTLAGKWRLNAKFSPAKSVKTGDAVTLVITGEGDRSAESLHAPDLSHEKFRIYPPEVKKKGNSFRLEYAMIPLAAGTFDLDFPLAVFDPQAGSYQLFRAQTRLAVTPGAAIAPEPARHLPEVSAEREETLARQKFFYPRPAGRNFVAVPLWQNVAAGLLSLLSAAVLIGVIAWAWSKRQHFTPAWHRRSQKRHLHQLLKRADAKTLAAQLPGAIGNLLQLPPGATAAEIAVKLDDPVVRDALEKCGASDFMPGNPAWEPDRKTRALIWRHLKKLFLFFGVFLPWMMQAEHALFDAGHFADAAKAYEAKYDPKRADVDLLYNIGAAHFHAENFAAARLALRRAHLLAPRDREIAGHLAEVEEKLQLPQWGRSRGAQIIDRIVGLLRPDEWLLAGGVVFAAFCVVLGFFPLLSGAWRKGAVGITAGLLLVCLFALWQEKRRLYFSQEAMVIAKTSLRTLPSESSGRSEATLAAGSDLRILQTQGKWLLVETPKGRGWVAASDVEKLFPSGLW